MDTYVARQPILNKQKETYGYELLFRDGKNNAFPSGISENRATYRIVAENFLTLGRNSRCEGSRCFINFTYNSIIQGLPFSLPREQVVIEIPGQSIPDDTLYSAVAKLHREGYILAIDDFTDTQEWERFIPLIHIIKIDVLDMGIDTACDLAIDLHEIGVTAAFLAEKIETQDEFEAALDAGFRYFQGYFFSKPKIVKQKYISPEQALALQLLTEVAKPEVDFNCVEQIIERDVSLSYKLLRFVNSLTNRIDRPIESFRQALVYLGHDKLKIFVSLTVASFIASEKPAEIYNLSMQRAQFCQLMACYKPFHQHQSNLFLIGLFSMLDALLDGPLESLIAELPLAEEAKTALISREGPLGYLLQMEECYEHADWEASKMICQQLELDFNDVSNIYLQAQKWSQEVSNTDN
ncbi:histidine kinase [Vibrio sp. HA2012]|uniref:EAL and HDOD domain-containing protein n=1 Tax=Vibrio sp. HA2012 TaxID=1971595 RepID=UPI000C2C5E81|nr:HDOD domain-containing protein [Vibrio sp. HA2012]PJC87479.1 histidine kinase [Vibrio sp. HA2012]